MPVINSIINWVNFKRIYQIDLFKKHPHEVQREVLTRTREKLADLEHRVARLEAELASRPPAQD